MQTIVAEKEGGEAAGFDSSLGESSGVQRLEQSVSMFDMQVAKENAVPGEDTLPLSPPLGRYRYDIHFKGCT